MKLLVYILSVAMMIAMPAQALTLDCKLTKYGSSIYSKKEIDSWVPKTQTHVLNLDAKKAVYTGTGIQGRVVYFDKGRIKWEYYAEATTVVDERVTNIQYYFTYFPRTKLFVPGIWFRFGIHPMDSLKGKCEVTKITKAEQKLLNNTPDTQQGADRSRVEAQSE